MLIVSLIKVRPNLMIHVSQTCLLHHLQYSILHIFIHWKEFIGNRSWKLGEVSGVWQNAVHIALLSA